MLKKIAILPTFVINHKINPTIERKPHTRSIYEDNLPDQDEWVWRMLPL